MALVYNTLKNDIQAAFTNGQAGADANIIAADLATAIFKFVQAGDVTTPVTTVVTGTFAGIGAGPIVGSGTGVCKGIIS